MAEPGQGKGTEAVRNGQCPERNRGHLEMNVYKPLMIHNIVQSITLLTDGCENFRKFLIAGTRPNLKKINEYVKRSLMLVTPLLPVIGYDRASQVAHHAMAHDLTLKQAA